MTYQLNKEYGDEEEHRIDGPFPPSIAASRRDEPGSDRVDEHGVRKERNELLLCRTHRSRLPLIKC